MWGCSHDFSPRQTFANTRFAQQLQLHLPQKVKATDQDSALRVEMSALEDQADDGKARELHWKPMSWLGTLRPTTVDDAWAPAIWQTFFTSTLGLEVPVLSSLPHHHNLPAAKCGCKKFLLDAQRRAATTSALAQLTQVPPRHTTGW